ncbi:MAG: SGNH/GDSL hydrolase family protein [Planctomycetota bacterium]
MYRVNLLSLLALLISCFAAPAELIPATAQSKRKNPAFEPVEDVDGLPRVLILGDSISIGYTVPVREALAGVANVHRPPENCSSSRTGAEKLDKWLGDERWDLIHFNFGLHDLKHVIGNSQQLVDVDNPKSHRQVELDEYRKHMSEIASRLKKTNAKLVWCNTTPVPEGAKGRLPHYVGEYNRVAAEVMSEFEIPTNDLHSFAAERLEKIQRKANVHFFPEGSKALARHVANVIREQLELE